MKGDDAVTAAFRGLLTVQSTAVAGYGAGNDIGFLIRARGRDFAPQIATLTEIYLEMYPHFAKPRREWLATRNDYLIFTTHPYLAFSWQIAWTISRAPQEEIAAQLERFFTSVRSDLELAISALQEDVSKYAHVVSYPLFGGGSGPPEEMDELLARSPPAPPLPAPRSAGSRSTPLPPPRSAASPPAPASAARPPVEGVSASDPGPLVLSRDPSGEGSAPDRNVLESIDPETAAGREYTVWYGTNRRLLDKGSAPRFSNSRDDKVHCGKCVVLLPHARAFGSLGSPAWKRWLTGVDDRARLSSTAAFRDTAAFLDDIHRTLLDREPFFRRRDVLVYIHGYQTTFEEAAIRAAQLGADLNVPGLTAFYSWPSRARFLGYLADEAAIEDAEVYIADFLMQLARDVGAERVHVIAHSMGNRGLLRAMQRITSLAEASGGVRFGQIFLAAPDVDVGTFGRLAAAYAARSQRTTMYVSARDRAVWLSWLLHMFPRVGFAPPITVVNGLDTIEVSGVDFSLIGHGAYAEASALITDMGHLIRVDQAPPLRQRIRPAKSAGGQTYWRFLA
jgi:esterase/lipase superfamily enzyme